MSEALVRPVPRLGLVVNPIAGMGGAVGLKVTDGEETLARAIERGAVAHAGERAAAALRAFAADARARGALFVAPGPMGADAAASAGVPASTVGTLAPGPTSAADTRRFVDDLVGSGVDLLCFAGGDGTARDVVADRKSVV
jgi:predicted polyphosphate/ATP-dependent NAD kinase